MLKQNLVLIGNGMAGVRTLEELLKLDPDRYNITVFGEEPYGNYNRIMLSPVLASEKTVDEIMLNDLQWYKDNNITLHTGKKITKIQRKEQKVMTDCGMDVSYDRLIIATGSMPFMLPLPGADKEGVIGFRDIKDVNTMMEATQKYKKAVVIGGGLLGLEAANGLMKQGMEVTVVHLGETLMDRQLDAPSATMLRKSLEERGMKFLMEHSSTEVLGDERVKGLRFNDGTEVEADLLVMAVGIKPSIELAASAGLHCERGIVVDDTMQTYDPKIYAVGECVQHRGIAYGLVAPLWDQAKVCANHLAEMGIARYLGTVTSTKLKVTGIDLFSAGDFIGNEETEEIVFQDVSAGVYKKVVLKDNIIIGAVMYGDTADGSWFFQMIKDEEDVSDFRDTLIFGQAAGGSDSGSDPVARVAAMADDAEICGCNGISKCTIVDAIKEKGLTTLAEVQAHTKASASCGTCAGLVESVISFTTGAELSAPKEKPVCGCTEATHEEVRKGIVNMQLTTMKAVREEFNWTNPDGCAGCRPALNYYLLCAFPETYQDDPQSRFINERAHGNIQKDGTYSVVPRMFGGLCTAQQLRDIADIADKFKVPEMKVTGGQRIDLFGIKKEELPLIWHDLSEAGFVSGHAYAKGLRTVKTCVGKTWCRFGTQNSTGLGVQLEELTWGSWMPHKFKIAVSGCPRNCAEATIKDFGVICVDSGYELHVAGNGGITVRVTDLLCKVETEEEVLEYCAAFTQFYREDAHYLERTAPWVERVGLEKVKNALESAEDRKALCERFAISQKKAQIDPWKERAQGAESIEFAPIKVTATGALA
ncbi:NAD(P)/FAD-dependent oxidoreductase [Leucothrix sargassi]|nr:NAD(P)/FAD-dependent oxidoreductase [Leucothrix sargassi]